MILLYILFGMGSAFGLVGLLEYCWQNKPPAWANQWPKSQAMRFAWGSAGLIVALGHVPTGILLILAGLPVCLAHLRLIERNADIEIHVSSVANDVYQTGKASAGRFLGRLRIGTR